MNPEEDHLYEIRGCNCGGTGEEEEEEIFGNDLTLEEMGWEDEKRVFLRKIEVKEEIKEEEEDVKIEVKEEEDKEEIPTGECRYNSSLEG